MQPSGGADVQAQGAGGAGAFTPGSGGDGASPTQGGQSSLGGFSAGGSHFGTGGSGAGTPLGGGGSGSQGPPLAEAACAWARTISRDVAFSITSASVSFDKLTFASRNETPNQFGGPEWSIYSGIQIDVLFADGVTSYFWTNGGLRVRSAAVPDDRHPAIYGALAPRLSVETSIGETLLLASVGGNGAQAEFGQTTVQSSSNLVASFIGEAPTSAVAILGEPERAAVFDVVAQDGTFAATLSILGEANHWAVNAFLGTSEPSSLAQYQDAFVSGGGLVRLGDGSIVQAVNAEKSGSGTPQFRWKDQANNQLLTPTASLLARLDASGELIHARVLTPTQSLVRVHSLARIPTGALLLLSQDEGAQTSLIELNDSLDIVQQWAFAVPNPTAEWSFAVAPDDTVWIAGHTGDNTVDMGCGPTLSPNMGFLVGLDASRTCRWHSEFSDFLPEAVAANGALVSVAGRRLSDGPSQDRDFGCGPTKISRWADHAVILWNR